MITKKYFTTFGYKVLRTNYEAGDSSKDDAPKARQWYNLFTRGGFANCVTDSASSPANYASENTTIGSWYTPTNFLEFSGHLSFNTPTDTTIWCLCQELNDKTFSGNINKWNLAKDATATLAVGTKLLLVRGSVIINAGESDEQTLIADAYTSEEQVVPSRPKAINVSTNASTITATSDHVYGILFA